MYTCTYRCPQVLATAANHPASRSSFTAPSLSAQHVPTLPSPRRRPTPPSSTSAHHKPRNMLHNPTHAMISSQTQPKMRIMLTITYHKFEPQGHGHVSTLCWHKLEVRQFDRNLHVGMHQLVDTWCPITTGDQLFAECQVVCRVLFFWHSAKTPLPRVFFDTRQRRSLPSVFFDTR